MLIADLTHEAVAIVVSKPLEGWISEQTLVPNTVKRGVFWPLLRERERERERERKDQTVPKKRKMSENAQQHMGK